MSNTIQRSIEILISEAPWRLALFDLGRLATLIALDGGNEIQKSLTKSKEKLRANLSSQEPVR
jgi:hypothetical protein